MCTKLCARLWRTAGDFAVRGISSTSTALAQLRSIARSELMEPRGTLRDTLEQSSEKLPSALIT